MTEVPTLSEMRHALDAPTPPSLAEMTHANLLYQTDPEAYLEHYGVKGMKWGVRRSRELLARAAGRTKAAIETKDDEGNVVGGIRAKTRAGAQKLKDMRPGSTLILEDAEGASKIMAKQKDGTFKEVYLSADAERVLRTTKKDQSEMSDKEINDAINRAKKIEEYNKLFNPQPNPNADLEARVKAMQLEVALRQAERTLNPPKEKMVKRFINTVSGGYGAYARANKATNGLIDDTMKQLIDDLRSSGTKSGSSGPGAAAAAAASAARNARQNRQRQQQANADKARYGGASSRTRPTNLSDEEQKRVDDFVYNITTMGRNDPSNPFYNPNPPGPDIPPYYPELER
jgi:hypothetical protein